MYRSNKKGFTIVELVVVIAVVAILAAVLIPTFASLVKKANASKDTQVVRDLNTALAVYVNEAITGKEATVYDAVEAAKEFGYDLAKIDAKADGNEIVWDDVNKVFCYLESGTPKYVPEAPAAEVVSDNADFWVIADEISTVYSTYYYGEGDIISDTATSICVVTAGADLLVNAPDADVYHYGDVANLTIEAVADASYHEFGRVTQLAIVKKGHVKVESVGSIGTIVVATADVALTGDFGLVMAPPAVLDSIELPEGTVAQAVESTEDLDNVVAIVDGTFYDDFATALAAANEKTVVLVRDVKFAKNVVFTINANQIVTIDLNGHAIMATAPEGKASAVITNHGNLTIKDSVGSGLITTNALNPDKQPVPGFASNTISNNGILVLDGGTIENTTDSGACFAVDNYQGATFTMNGGKVVAVKTAVRLFANSRTLEDKVVINGGTLEGSTGVWIQIPNDKGTTGFATLIITGGTFNATKQSIYEYSYGDDRTLVTINVTGGTFNSKMNLVLGETTSEYKEFSVTNATVTDGIYFNGVKQ